MRVGQKLGQDDHSERKVQSSMLLM